MKLMRWDKDGMIRHGMIVLLFTHGAGVANLLFHAVMGRKLSGPEYGVLASMLSIFLLVATPLAAVNNTLAHYTAHLRSQGRLDEIRGLVWSWLLKLSLIGVPVFLAVLLLRHPIAAYFHLSSAAPVIALAVTLLMALFIPVFTGTLQGLQAFIWMSITGNSWGVVRLVLGWGLVVTVLTNALAGLWAHGVGNMLSVVLGVAGLTILLPRASRPYDGSGEGSHRYFVLSLIALAGFSALMNADMAMVKHFFSNPDDYGPYARASTIARTMIFIAQPLAVAMFPKVISKGVQLQSHAFILLKAIVFAGLIIGGAALFCTLFPQWALLALFKEHAPHERQILLVRYVSWAMAPLGLTFLVMNYELAQRRFFCVVPLLVSAAGFLIGVRLFHESLAQVVVTLGIVSTFSLVSMSAITLTTRRDLKE